jgi:Transglycosylase SLT domain
MLEARRRWKRVPTNSLSVIVAIAVALVISLSTSPTPSPAATTNPLPTRGVHPVKAAPALRQVMARSRSRQVAQAQTGPVVTELAAFTSAPTPSDGYVVALIHKDFPARAWHDAEAVAWCESKFRTTDIGFDSNGTHDRGLFQLNDGGTEQYLMAMIGQNPKNLALAFNPVLNVRAAALLFARDGWSQWSCQTAI